MEFEIDNIYVYWLTSEWSTHSKSKHVMSNYKCCKEIGLNDMVIISDLYEAERDLCLGEFKW